MLEAWREPKYASAYFSSTEACMQQWNKKQTHSEQEMKKRKALCWKAAWSPNSNATVVMFVTSTVPQCSHMTAVANDCQAKSLWEIVPLSYIKKNIITWSQLDVFPPSYFRIIKEKENYQNAGTNMWHINVYYPQFQIQDSYVNSNKQTAITGDQSNEKSKITRQSWFLGVWATPKKSAILGKKKMAGSKMLLKPQLPFLLLKVFMKSFLSLFCNKSFFLLYFFHWASCYSEQNCGLVSPKLFLNQLFICLYYYILYCTQNKSVK